MAADADYSDASDQDDQPQQNNQVQKRSQQQQQQQQQGNSDGAQQGQKQEQQTSYRTVQQQQKHDNAVKQAHRDHSQGNRSRSASRRARRKRITQAIDDGKFMKTNSLEALEEADASGELQQMGMFERIGPDSTSMDGPVTHARAMRGEIPMRGTDPNQPYRLPTEAEKKGGLDESEGLKLTLEANLDIEIELKASIRGDLTLSLFE